MHHFIETNGIKLHYLEAGDGAGEPLILLHGLTANATSFNGLIHAGLAENRHVRMIDLRGRGLSDKPESDYRMADHAADIIGLMDALEIDSVVLGGHSFGGLLTLYIAANFPDRVKKLVVIDAAAAAARQEVVEIIRPSLQRLERTVPSKEQFISAMQAAPYFHDGFWDADLEAYYRADIEMLDDGSVRTRSRAAHIGQVIDGVLAEDWFGHLAKIKQPVLLLNASEGLGPAGSAPVLSTEGAMETVNALADCTYQQVSGNHMTMLFGKFAPGIVQAINTFIDA